MTVSGVDEAPRSDSSGRPSWRVICWAFVAVAALILLWQGIARVHETEQELRLIPYLRYDARTDYVYFYAAGTMALNGEASDLYPGKSDAVVSPGDPAFAGAPDDDARARLVTRGSYYNPPALAYFYAPAAAVPFRYSYWLLTGLGLAALAGFLVLAWRATRGIAEAPLVIAGVLVFRATHEVAIMGHPTFFFLLALTGGFLLLRAEKPVLAGLAFSLLALKPQWVVLPALFLLVRGEWRAVAALAAASAAIVLAPFLVTGVHSFENYLRVSRLVAEQDLKDAPHMFSWNGFLFKLRGGPAHGGTPPPAWQIYALMALTVLPYLAVLRSRDFLLGAAATVLTMLLVSIHSVWYDWAMLSAAGLFLVMRAPQMSRGHRVEMWVVMLAVFLAVLQSTGALLVPGRHEIDWHRQEFFSITPVAFAALVWMASLAWREGMLRLPWASRPVAAST